MKLIYEKKEDIPYGERWYPDRLDQLEQNHGRSFYTNIYNCTNQIITVTDHSNKLTKIRPEQYVHDSNYAGYVIVTVWEHFPKEEQPWVGSILKKKIAISLNAFKKVPIYNKDANVLIGLNNGEFVKHPASRNIINEYINNIEERINTKGVLPPFAIFCNDSKKHMDKLYYILDDECFSLDVMHFEEENDRCVVMRSLPSQDRKYTKDDLSVEDLRNGVCKFTLDSTGSILFIGNNESFVKNAHYRYKKEQTAISEDELVLKKLHEDDKKEMIKNHKKEMEEIEDKLHELKKELNRKSVDLDYYREKEIEQEKREFEREKQMYEREKQEHNRVLSQYKVQAAKESANVSTNKLKESIFSSLISLGKAVATVIPAIISVAIYFRKSIFGKFF